VKARIDYVRSLVLGRGCPRKQIDQKARAGGGGNSLPTPPEADAGTTSGMPYSENRR